MSYKFTTIYVFILILINLFHFKVEKILTGLTGKTFLIYFIFAVLSALAIIFLFIALLERNNNKIALVLLSMGLIFFFLLSRPILTARMNVFEFFILGVFVSLESKKTRLALPFLILIFVPVFAEIGNTLEFGSSFFYLDAWVNMLTSLSGYVSMSLFRI